MSSIGHQLLKKHFPHKGILIAKLDYVCHNSSLLNVNGTLYDELCHDIVERGQDKWFWLNFTEALEDAPGIEHNYEAAAEYIAEFFPKVRVKRSVIDGSSVFAGLTRFFSQFFRRGSAS